MKTVQPVRAELPRIGHCRKDLSSPGLCYKIGGIYILKHLQYIVRFCFCLVVVVVLFCFVFFFSIYEFFWALSKVFINLFIFHTCSCEEY